MKNFKRMLAVFMVLVLAFSMNALVLSVSAAEDDIVLDGGEEGVSTMIKDFDWTKTTYKYLGFVTTNGATADYKYLQFTYTGDISTLRLEFEDVDNGIVPNSAKFWFNQDTTTDEDNKLVVAADGTTLTLNASTPTTVTIDLSKMGVSLGDYSGIHMHYSAVEGVTPTGFKVTDARLTKTAAAGASTPAPEQSSGSSDENPKTGVASVLPIALAAVACAGVLVVARKKK